MFKLQLATVLCFALASVPSFAQGISSSTCYGFGGTSCTAYVFGTYIGSVTCNCAALCTNSRNVSASYALEWACAYAATADLFGGPQSYSIKVAGSLLNTFTNIYIGHGFDEQDCDGNFSGVDFSNPC